MSERKRQASELLAIMLSHVVGIVFSVVALKLMSSVLSPEDYGNYAVYGTLTTLGILSIHGSLYCVAVRIWDSLGEERHAFVSFFIRTLMMQLCVVAPFVMVAAWVLHTMQQDSRWLTLAPFVLVAIVLVSTTDTLRGVIHAERRRWTLLLTKFVDSFARAILPTSVFVIFGGWFGWACIGYTLFLLVSGIVHTLALRNALPAKAVSSQQKEAWRCKLRDYGRPFIFTGIIGWLLTTIDVWLAIFFFPDALGGHYAMAINLCSVIAGVSGSTLLVWAFPMIFKKADTAQCMGDWLRLKYQTYTLWLILLATVSLGVYALYVLEPWIVGPIIDARYAAAWPMLFFGAATIMHREIMQLPFLLLQGLENSVDTLKILSILLGIKIVVVLVSIQYSADVFLYGQFVSLGLMAVVGIFLLDSKLSRILHSKYPDAR